MKIKASKPIAQIGKGDVINVDSKAYEVDAHYVLIDHGTTKEMAIEIFDPKDDDSDCQIRYFNDQAEETITFYVFNGLMYDQKEIEKVEW